MAKVSIIMPLYNCQEQVPQAVKSVLLQTFLDWELIIVDDQSLDDSFKVVSSFKDSRIKIFRNNTNLGAALTRNFALEKASGKYIAFLDADDKWLPNKLEIQITSMEKRNIDFCYSPYYEQNGKHCFVVTGPRHIGRAKMLMYCWPGCLTVVFNQDKLGKPFIPNLRRRNDYAMWLILSRRAKCYLVNEKVAIYNKRPGTISDISSRKKIRYAYNVFFHSENFSHFFSWILAINNGFWAIFKKIIYKKKCSETDVF